MAAYAKNVKNQTDAAAAKKQSEADTIIAAQLDSMIHAEEKDYFEIAKSLFSLLATKEPDLTKKIGIRRAEKLEAVLSHDGVD